MRRQFAAGFAVVLPVLLGLSACMSSEKNEGLTRVDDLLTRVEQVQIESLVAREKASGAFDALGLIVAPEFQGDPMLVYDELLKQIEASKAQARKLEQTVEPMKRTADIVFQSWTMDLEKFGNTNLRQQSQSRLAETRARYSAVHDAAVAALVSINAFNADLNDQALFLGHDFNVAAVAVIAAEVPGLTSHARDLGRRLNACVTASKEYISSSALRGQMEAQPAPSVAANKPQAAQPASRLPNPINEATPEETATAQQGMENSAPIAPARRRPRVNANPLETPSPAAQPEGAVGPQPTANGTTQQTSVPVKPITVLGPQTPKPETDLTSQPKPAPIEPAGGGNQ